MIRPDDVIALPSGVRLRHEGLHDEVRALVVSVNTTGAVALQSSTPRLAGVQLARLHGLDEACVVRDVVAFCAELNARCLLNVESRRTLRTCMRSTRHGVDTATLRSTVVTASCALRGVAFVFFLLAGAVAAATFVILGVGSLQLAAAAGAAVSLTIVTHELGHLLALVRVPAFVATRALRVSVVHRRVPPARTAIVAAAGPLSGVAPAALALAVLAVAPAPEWAVAGSTFSLNALGLTVLTRDGRTLCGLS